MLPSTELTVSLLRSAGEGELERFYLSSLLAVTVCAALPAHAGMPKGAMLIADEQTGDETTGETIARGNAELTIAVRGVRARADEIAIRPGRNEITFTGRALVFVGHQRFESEAVTCTLDLTRCVDAHAAPPPLPMQPTEQVPNVPQAEPQTTAATTPL